MNDRRTNEEREAMIRGELDRELSAEEADDLALFADLLGDPATWAEPDLELEDRVVDAVVNAPAGAPVHALRRRRRVVIEGIAAVAAAAAIALGAVAVMGGGSGPDFTGRLAATALAPSARASVSSVHNRAGFRITLDAHGLTLLPTGEYYQAWLKNAAGTLVPIGTFSSSDGRVTLWSGVSPKDFPTLTVTIEKTDNDQTSSGLRVLVGTVQSK